MTEFEDHIRAMTVPRNGAYPRPWMCDADPTQAVVLIVGASSAKTFHVADVGNHDEFLDALWNRNGRTCRAMYDAATTKPSPTRRNLDQLSAMLSVHGLSSLQTNVTCASARYDAEVSEGDRAHGTELFKMVVAHVPWKAMIVYGTGASKRFGRAFGVSMPPVPSPDSAPVSITIQGSPVFISPTLAYPGYRASVWAYLQNVVAAIADGGEAVGTPMPRQYPMPAARSVQTQDSSEDAVPSGMLDTPAAFNASAANRFVWQRMHAIAAASALNVDPSKYQAALICGPVLSSTDRVFRHKFQTAKADLLVREDVFRFHAALRDAAWTTHKTAVFQRIQTDDLQLLGRILDAVEAFAVAQSP